MERKTLVPDDNKNRFNRIWYPAAALLLLLVLFQGCSSSGQEGVEPMETLPMKEIDLSGLEAFQTPDSNWTIAGDVKSERMKDRDLTPIEGSGILVNTPTEDHRSNLFTSFSHGDLELELDLLVPKGSNSGIYLMGRYEVQVLDSWGVDEPSFSDLGGIYQRWDESRPEGERGYEGHAPKVNAAWAPGLWQHYRILFHAPEFDDEGNKVKNAIFKEVWVNGVMVQEDVEVTGPTRAAAHENEVAEAPMMIQGDHGPVAYRNIIYKRYDKKQVGLTDLTYEYYPGEFEELPDFDSIEADESGSADSLAGNLITRDDRFALRYTGTLNAPNSGTYLFKLRNAGMVRMLIDGAPVFDQSEIHNMNELDSETVELEAGSHSVTLEYMKHPNNWYRGLSLFVEGPRLRLQQLHRSSSVQGGGREIPDLIVNPGEDRVKTLRSFAMHNGSKRTHVINVGAPNGIHYSYDLGQAALLHAWEGSFVNANEMWINRGQPQITKPAGPPIAFNGFPSIAMRNAGSAAWPDSLSWDQLDVKGYSLDADGWPTFKYSMGAVEVADSFRSPESPRHLTRTVSFQADEPRDDFSFQLASGSTITRSESGEYVVDNRSYYLNVIDTGTADVQLVEGADGDALRISPLAEAANAEITYEIIW